MPFLPTVPEDERSTVSTLLLMLMRNYREANPELKSRILPRTSGTPMIVLTNASDSRYYVVLVQLVRDEKIPGLPTYRLIRHD